MRLYLWNELNGVLEFYKWAGACISVVMFGQRGDETSALEHRFFHDGVPMRIIEAPPVEDWETSLLASECRVLSFAKMLADEFPVVATGIAGEKIKPGAVYFRDGCVWNVPSSVESDE